MKKLLHKKSAGFYVSMTSMVLAIAALVGFLIWAPGNNTMDQIIVIGLGVGIVLNVLLVFVDTEFAAVGASAAFSVALFKLLSNSVGSFVDAFQGIVMFGDATQLPVIYTLAALMLLAVITTIVACFMGRVKRV